MSRLSLGSLALSLSVVVACSFLLSTDRVEARQAAGTPERVKFDTFDSVELTGNFYPSTRGNKAPCAILLHAFGENSQKDGWDEVAKELQKKGIAVLTFDFRGHGDSTTVGPGFWTADRVNLTLKTAKNPKSKDKLSYKDFTSSDHYYMMVNDIQAARRFLERKNDSGECNASNMILIGAETGATLGALWTHWAWQVQRVQPALLGQVPSVDKEGKDVACAVWLSLSPSVGGSTKVNPSNWMRAPVREKVPMYFIYGEKDVKGAKLAKQLHDGVLKANTDKSLKHTGLKAIPETKLTGRELLDKSFGTAEMIVKYVTKVLDDRGTNVWTKREVERTLPRRIDFERLPR